MAEQKQYNKNRKTSSNEGLSRMMAKKQPHNIEAEKTVLSALLLEKDAFAEVCEMLRIDSFFLPAHQLIYEAIQTLAMQQQNVDFITVADQLKKMKKLKEAGGEEYLLELSNLVSSTAFLDTHAKLLYDAAAKRDLIHFSNEVLQLSYDDSVDVLDTMQEAESKLFSITQQNHKNDVVPVNSIIDEAMSQIESAYNRKDNISGLNTGFTEIDKMTSGWQNSDLIIIAARPAMGKTAFVLSMARKMAMDYDTPVAVFSLEMSKVQLLTRLIVSQSEIENDKVKRGDLTPDEFRRLTQAVSELRAAPIYIDDNAGLSVFDFRSKARRLVREHDVKMIVIDYLQLMTASGMRSNANREQEVSMISRSLKNLAKELNIPIVALSQLNRGVEARQGDAKRPQLADLRESGAIEQDADIVCFIHRPEYYKIFESNGINYRGLAEFIIAKHRNGPTGDIFLRYRGEILRFSDGTDLDYVSENADIRRKKSSLGSSMSEKPMSGNDELPPL